VVIVLEPLTAADAAEVDAWRYEPPYDFYDGEEDPVLNPERFFVVRDSVGVACFYYFDDRGDTVEYGLGLRPDLTGRGRGAEFFRAGLEFAHDRFAGRRVVLNVAGFNARAIKVYERAGFQVTGRHTRTFARWGDVEFIEMAESA
jgi:ribosomal-protein-alanine N-acetyltransferase